MFKFVGTKVMRDTAECEQNYGSVVGKNKRFWGGGVELCPILVGSKAFHICVVEFYKLELHKI